MNLHFIVQYEILIRLYGGRRLTTSRSQLLSCFHEDCFANYCHASEKIPDDSAFMNDAVFGLIGKGMYLLGDDALKGLKPFIAPLVLMVV